MHAATIDTGATISVLRAFGPPELVTLDDFAMIGGEAIGTNRLWTVVHAVSFEAIVSAGGGTVRPRLTWLDADGVAFAQAFAPADLNGGQDVQVTFAVGMYPQGTFNGLVFVAPIPELVMLPGSTLKLDDVLDIRGSTVHNFRAYVQRYKPIVVDELIED